MSALKDGVYKATANGYHDLIHVDLHIVDNKIEKIEYQHKDTPDTGGLAIQYIIEQIVETQSIDIDRVPGARYSSIGILTAVNKALKVARGELSQAEALKVNTQETVGEYSDGEEPNVVTKMSDSSSERLRLKGGSLDLDQAIALLKVLPSEYLIYNVRGRLDFVHVKDDDSKYYQKVGLHFLDINEETPSEKWNQFREGSANQLEVSNDTVYKLKNTHHKLVGYAQILSE